MATSQITKRPLYGGSWWFKIRLVLQKTVLRASSNGVGHGDICFRPILRMRLR